MSHTACARRIFDIELAALQAVRSQLDASFDAAVITVVDCLEAKGKLIVVGIGKSGNVGRKISATLTRCW
jgi:arabinose-5-phosphate isomerase